MRKYFFIVITLFLSVSSLVANDIYILKYSPDTNCTLLKNKKEIPSFDPRFKKKSPRTSYTCSAIQKEQYNECHIVSKKNVAALFFSYGPYEYTNFLIAFKAPVKHIKSKIKVECTKSLVH